MRHCWFDFGFEYEDADYFDDGQRLVGHTCMLPDGHDGPHEPTSDDEITISFVGDPE